MNVFWNTKISEIFGTSGEEGSIKHYTYLLTYLLIYLLIYFTYFTYFTYLLTGSRRRQTSKLAP